MCCACRYTCVVNLQFLPSSYCHEGKEGEAVSLTLLFNARIRVPSKEPGSDIWNLTIVCTFHENLRMNSDLQFGSCSPYRHRFSLKSFRYASSRLTAYLYPKTFYERELSSSPSQARVHVFSLRHGPTFCPPPHIVLSKSSTANNAHNPRLHSHSLDYLRFSQTSLSFTRLLFRKVTELRILDTFLSHVPYRAGTCRITPSQGLLFLPQPLFILSIPL